MPLRGLRGSLVFESCILYEQRLSFSSERGKRVEESPDKRGTAIDISSLEQVERNGN